MPELAESHANKPGPMAAGSAAAHLPSASDNTELDQEAPMRFHWHVEAGLSAWMPATGPDDQHRDTDVRTVAAEIEVRS